MHDHRNSSTTSQTTSATSNKDLSLPASIHNYNKFITPSSFVVYPRTRRRDIEDGPESEHGHILSSKAGRSPNDIPEEVERTEGFVTGPRIFTTVLFPTAFSLQEELAKIASTPDARSSGRKQGQSSTRTATSTNAPPTPSSGSFSTAASAAPNRRQKLMYNAKDLVEIESKIVSATAPPLFLEPVDSLQEGQALIEKLYDSTLDPEPSAPKSRKRTVAELAADEALAAEEQRFMLIMDERLIPNSSASTTNKSSGAGGEAGHATFEARFERFKAIDEIRNLQQEKKQREQEAKVVYQQQQQKLKMEQQERDVAAAAAHQQALQEQKTRDGINAQRQEQLQQLQARQLHNQNQQMLQQQQHASQAVNQHAHPQTSAATMHNAQQLTASQPIQSSPVIGNLTPHNASSPHAINGMLGHGNQSIPMSTSTSNQGAGSPPRPGSAMQHQHQAITMAAQRSQQPPSRNSTPAMPNGTPRIQQSTPVMRNVTPTPRMNHASPVNPAVSVSTMNQFVVGTPHMNGQQHMTPQQQQQLLYHQRQQALHNQHMQGSPQNGHMSGQNMQQFAAQQYAAAAHQRAGTEANYRQSLQNMTQQQMNNSQMGQQGFANGLSMHPMQIQQNMSHQASGMQQNNKWQVMYQSAATQFLQRFREQAIAAYGPQIPPLVSQQIRTQADAKARSLVQAKRQQENAARQQMIAHQLQNNGGNMGGMGGMGGMNAI